MGELCIPLPLKHCLGFVELSKMTHVSWTMARNSIVLFSSDHWHRSTAAVVRMDVKECDVTMGYG